MTPDPDPVVELSTMVELVALAVVALLTLALLLVTGRRLAGGSLTRRREHRFRAARPALLALLADDTSSSAAIETLAALDTRSWQVVEPRLVEMLGKVRGEARDRLVAVLDERGTVRRARSGTRSWSFVRRCRAAEMLGAAGAADAVADLAALLHDSNAEVRSVAARALGRIGASTAVEALLAAVASPRRLSAREAAAALAGLGAPGLSALSVVAGGPRGREAAYAREALAMHSLGSSVRDRSLVAVGGPLAGGR